MHVAIWMVCLVATIVTGSVVARRVNLPAPVLLVALGVLASYLPFVPEVRLTADIVLVGLLPPLLYNAALQTSLVDFSAHRVRILSLSVGLVAFTTVGVALVVHTVVPSIDWWAAFAIGAVVAPPDAVAATAVARRIGMPRPVVTVLEGESLLNDATALVALRTAVAAGASAVSLWEIGLDFLRTAALGVLCGLLVYVVVAWVRRHVTDPVVDTSVSVVTPFVAYVLAEELHASGVLAVVIAGLLLGHRAPVLQTASSRIAEGLNWRTVSFLLENAVFLLIGLQTHWILEGVARSTLSVATVVGTCLAVFVAVIVLRMVWLLPQRVVLFRYLPERVDRVPLSDTLLIGWAGMRGVVTLAAAFAIPADAPHREVLLLVALFVTAATLSVNGLSLPWLVRRLHVRGPDPREDALARADVLTAASQAGRARLEEIEAEEDEQDVQVRELLRSKLEQRDFAAWERLGPHVAEGETPSERYARLRLDMLDAERARVLEIRSMGRVPHEVVEDVLATLDVEESMLAYRVARRASVVDATVTGEVVSAVPERCEHLESTEDRPEPEDRRCEDCVREGSTWVHLRQCLACGHVGCCDSSPRRHATAHFHESGHPVVRSAEVGESWRWCFVDDRLG
ncbi:Na+/H+ antiporter [Nocardioides caldifontis]|uniref:Na+/H+ antiporter n=1 Tax=Nocardioides caldifontis TaxID=2588938 RepID=UPI0011DF4C92|nr:Na+/H+ antiporter [Nocardioides caldifontis]